MLKNSYWVIFWNISKWSFDFTILIDLYKSFYSKSIFKNNITSPNKCIIYFVYYSKFKKVFIVIIWVLKYNQDRKYNRTVTLDIYSFTFINFLAKSNTTIDIFKVALLFS